MKTTERQRVLPCLFHFRLCPRTVLTRIRREFNLAARTIQIIECFASPADITIIAPVYPIKVVFSDVFAVFVNQSVFSVAICAFHRAFPQSASCLNGHQSVVKHGRADCNTAVNVIAEHIHIFVKQNQLWNIILMVVGS
ncbi:MAG: hypothetical protein ACLR4Z_00330 [Butyricicoccaceae bacterium]